MLSVGSAYREHYEPTEYHSLHHVEPTFMTLKSALLV